MRIAAGLDRPERGRIVVRGREIGFRSPREARQAGIGMVHQHFTSIPAFTVAENVALGVDGPIRSAVLSSRIRTLNHQLGFDLDPADRSGDLPVAALQRLEILKLLVGDASILILDEPTGSLSQEEGNELLHLLRRLVGQGSSAVLITHKLDEAIRFADRVTVIRRGQVTASGPIAGQTTSDLARAMLGETVAGTSRLSPPRPGEPVVTARAVTVGPIAGRGPGIREANFVIHAGETVGLASVEGNGERELLRAVAGLAPVKRGSLEVRQPVSLVPEDRIREALVPEFSLSENATLALGRAAPWVRRGIIHPAEALTATSRLIEEYQIGAPGPAAAAGTLSGGNQQKLALALALQRGSRVIVAENPGRGLDVRAARLGFEWLRAAAGRGAGILVFSSDLDELLGWCDRLLVVSQGQVYSPPAGSGREEIGRLLLAGRS
jgi:simple sugar transport system ATP-binding protein